MSQHPEGIDPDKLSAFLQKLSPENRQRIMGSESSTSPRKETKLCEDFFAKLELLLPTHDVSRREVQHLLRRILNDGNAS